MPNGGSDCCGTCWFNTANDGQPGYCNTGSAVTPRCSIRDLTIDDPFYTYCANHPHHNPERIEIPIGPVYVTADYVYARRILVKCPDSERVRAGLLELLDAIEEKPRMEYPSATTLDEEVIKQLMDFKEPRAVPGLRRISRFDPRARSDGEDILVRTRVPTVALAIEALATIEGDAALDALEAAVQCGLEELRAASRTLPKNLLTRVWNSMRRGRGDPDEQVPDPMAAIRYHAVLGLKHCTLDKARDLLMMATQDPHPEVAAFAQNAVDGQQHAE